jgi:hypothetical protein
MRLVCFQCGRLFAHLLFVIFAVTLRRRRTRWSGLILAESAPSREKLRGWLVALATLATTVARLNLALMFFGFNLTFFPMHTLGLQANWPCNRSSRFKPNHPPAERSADENCLDGSARTLSDSRRRPCGPL